jgi:hypothetical protein
MRAKGPEHWFSLTPQPYVIGVTGSAIYQSLRKSGAHSSRSDTDMITLWSCILDRKTEKELTLQQQVV